MMRPIFGVSSMNNTMKKKLENSVKFWTYSNKFTCQDSDQCDLLFDTCVIT